MIAVRPSRRFRHETPPGDSAMSDIATVLLGFLGGVVSGLLGVGGGILFVPTLAIFQDQSQLHAEATSLLAIVPVAMVAAYRQSGYGNVRVRDGLVIGALSPIGVLIGVEVANAVSQRTLELGFSALSVFIAARLIKEALRPAD
ncbi:MAG: TSUP family transporter [Solirubrobacterales bacterium]